VIEALLDGVVRLHLSSDHRLSTDFNWYARLWTDAIMRDIQTTILQVIRSRCESAASVIHTAGASGIDYAPPAPESATEKTGTRLIGHYDTMGTTIKPIA
jgi:hypothetical protein